LICFYVLYFF